MRLMVHMPVRTTSTLPSIISYEIENLNIDTDHVQANTYNKSCDILWDWYLNVPKKKKMMSQHLWTSSFKIGKKILIAWNASCMFFANPMKILYCAWMEKSSKSQVFLNINKIKAFFFTNSRCSEERNVLQQCFKYPLSKKKKNSVSNILFFWKVDLTHCVKTKKCYS